MSDAVPASTYHKDHPFPARLVENRLLNKPGSHKETRHMAVDIAGSGLTYKVGDSLGVFPANRPDEVDEILARLSATGNEPVSPVMLKLAAPIPLREALTGRLALAKPTRKIVETLAAKATAEADKTRLAALLVPEAKDQLAGWLEEREFVDLLAEFPSAKLTPQELVDHMRKLMPRLYSIASSPKLFPTEVHLTVAVVRYETNHRSRVGVATTFLADRAELKAAPVPVFVSDSHFGVPADGAKDIIMVGPGTGIAPFRAFLQERVATKATGRNWLFFGDQHRATDYLYEEEWKAWHASGALARVDLAFSRDQILKVYVQDRMRENAAELWAWLKAGAHFYVCGDAKRMAKDVDVALHDVIAQQGGLDAAAAADYVKQMKKDKRYQRDVY
ncbi:sulfite reductase subunit alpha [Opitutus sp. GAS368]|uniref:sulfite reductase subunit alpha n=1 Tax=Opitutus sp. GAS368 TaxID=1882749 RepID=UPI00087BF868|nr:sulfite reductase subunit alpha [Opitutus sp. GAS368]SDS35345.1 sulfite reductase (NADPH) flavoprotein alpha-component [Opitutus sp. GAS368]